jgi:hypothetical protein
MFAPIATAAISTGFVAILDAALVAPVFENSFTTFWSTLGTWIPFGLIFLSTLVAGLAVGTRLGRCPREVAPGVYWFSAGAVAGNVYFVQSGSSWVLAQLRQFDPDFGKDRPAAGSNVARSLGRTSRKRM